MGDKVYDVSAFDHPGTVKKLVENSDGQDALQKYNEIGHT